MNESLIQIRSATSEDFPAIKAIIRQTRLNPVSLDWRRFWIAVDGSNQLVGCGQIKPHKDGSQELASIAVLPSYRHQRLASQIIETLLSKSNGILYLTCRARLETFYNQFGFQKASYPEMTPYFRRLKRLSQFLRWIRLLPGEMLVMVRQEKSVS